MGLAARRKAVALGVRGTSRLYRGAPRGVASIVPESVLPDGGCTEICARRTDAAQFFCTMHWPPASFRLFAERGRLFGGREGADVDAIPRTALTKVGAANDRVTGPENARVFLLQHLR